MNDLYPNAFKNLTRNPIIIILLDGRKQTMAYDKTTKLSTLFEATCDLCNIERDDLFGFSVLIDDYYAFLDLETKVCKINFKEFQRRAQYNILFKPKQTYNSPIHRVSDEEIRHSHKHMRPREFNKLMLSTSSTKSAPVYASKGNSVSDDDNTPIIYFRVKSYVYGHCLRERLSKSLYFQQMMRNVLDYKVMCADEIYLQLGALAIQAFYGDHSKILPSICDDRTSLNSTNTESSTGAYSPTLARLSRSSDKFQNLTLENLIAGKYFEPRKFFPEWIIKKYTNEYLYKEIPELHKSLEGVIKFEAEFRYIRMASAGHSNFNMHLFPVRDQTLSGSHTGFFNASAKTNEVSSNQNKLWLGLSPAGLEMHEMKNSDFLVHLSTLKWSDISEITHKTYKIFVNIGCRTLKLYTNTKMQADHLFWLTRHMHMYQTKARLNATCTAEFLDDAERQNYREKYIYMDIEDFKKHAIDHTDEEPMTKTGLKSSIRLSDRGNMLPAVCTPSVSARRTPSKAKPAKMKEIVKANHNSIGEQGNGTNKKPQYIKKSQQSAQVNYIALQKVSSSDSCSIDRWDVRLNDFDDDLPKNANCSENESDCMNKSLSDDQNTSKAYETLDDSDCESSFYDSGGRSPGQIGPKQTGRFFSLTKDQMLQETSSISTTQDSISPTEEVLPPQQFRESKSNNYTNIVKSVSFDSRDIDNPHHQSIPQRQMSDSKVNYIDLRRSAPLLIGLCQEFNNTQIINDIKSVKLSQLKNVNLADSSVGMKSWKSDILFNLNRCVDYNTESDVESQISEIEQSGRRPSLPRWPMSYRDIVSSSSTVDTANDHDSVEISSLSSFEMNNFSYPSIHISHSNNVLPNRLTII